MSFHSRTFNTLFKVNNLQTVVADHVADSDTRFSDLGREIQIIRSNHVTEIRECRRSSDGLDRRLSNLEKVSGRFDSVSGKLEGIKEGLDRHVSGLWTSVNGLNVTVTSQGNAIENIQNVQLPHIHSNIHRLNSSVVDLVRDFHRFKTRDFKGESQRADGVGFECWSRDSCSQLKGGTFGLREK